MATLDNIRLPRSIFLMNKTDPSRILNGKKHKLLSMVISGNNIAMKFYFGSLFQILKNNKMYTKIKHAQ